MKLVKKVFSILKYISTPFVRYVKGFIDFVNDDFSKKDENLEFMNKVNIVMFAISGVVIIVLSFQL